MNMLNYCVKDQPEAALSKQVWRSEWKQRMDACYLNKVMYFELVMKKKKSKKKIWKKEEEKPAITVW